MASVSQSSLSTLRNQEQRDHGGPDAVEHHGLVSLGQTCPVPSVCAMMFNTSPPHLVIVTGMPSSGKTTIAESVARRLRLPLISKDEIKERLYDSLGSGDVAWSSQLGRAAYALIFVYARALLASGVTTMVEANFFRGQEEEFQALPEHRVVQIHCEAALPILLDRYASRARHPGHHDRQKINELAARFEHGAHAPLRLDGDLIRLDTTGHVDEAVVADRIRQRLQD
jgi:predicted kinase